MLKRTVVKGALGVITEPELVATWGDTSVNTKILKMVVDDTLQIDEAQEAFCALPNRGACVRIAFGHNVANETTLHKCDRLINQLAQMADQGYLWANLSVEHSPNEYQLGRESLLGYLAINMGGPAAMVFYFPRDEGKVCFTNICLNTNRRICGTHDCSVGHPDNHLEALERIVGAVEKYRFILQSGGQPPTIRVLNKRFYLYKYRRHAATVGSLTHMRSAALVGTFKTSDGVVFELDPDGTIFILECSDMRDYHIATDGDQYWSVLDCEDAHYIADDYERSMAFIAVPPAIKELSQRDTELIHTAIKVGLGEKADYVKGYEND